MRILLLGEYSSYHKYLKEGLMALGHQVTLVSSGDGYKKIGGADIRLPEPAKSFWDRNRYYTEWKQLIHKINGYDVVQMVSSCILPLPLSGHAFDYIKANNKCVSVASVGTNYATVRAYEEGAFEYYVYDQWERERYRKHSIKGSYEIKKAEYIEKRADIIIPGAYEYKKGYENYRNISDVIPFAVNTDQIVYEDNIVGDKIIIFHGINRPQPKGSALIISAMEKVKRDHPYEVDILITKRIPFDKYIQVVKKINVLADQCRSYGYGINACIAMAQGKITMSGFREETLHEMGVTETPGVSIRPDVDYIYDRLVNIIKKRDQITEWGRASRKYIEKNHDYVKIAQRYVKAWQSVGKA